MIKFKKLTIALLALLSFSATAWADGEKYTVQFKANGNTKTVEDVTLPHTFSCSYNKANDELDMILKELYGWTGSSDDTFCSPDAPSSDDASKATTGKNGNNQYVTISNAFEGTVTVTGKYCINYIKTPYSLEISISVVETPLMTLNSTNTVATMTMPESDVTVEYELVRDLTQQVTFGGIPTGDGLVVKNNGTAYEFVTAPTFTLTDALADNANIISDEGITITTQKKGDGDTWTTLDETALAAGYAHGTYRLVATANADGPYDGTIYSAEFTTVEKYDLAIQPADDFSKGKLSEVTVAGTAQTLDADGKVETTTVTGAEVKLKAKRGYVIEKVEAKKTSTAAEGVTLAESTVGMIVGSDGKAYAAADKDNLPENVTAVAMVAYKGNASNCANGLAIALEDVSSNKLTWNNSDANNGGKTATEWCSAWNTSKAVTGGTWRLSSIMDWQYMLIGCGASGTVSNPPASDGQMKTMSYGELASKLSTAGGTALNKADAYWSSSPKDSEVWFINIGNDGSTAKIYYGAKNTVRYVRAVLAF